MGDGVRQVVVVGGGTAGFMAAAAVRAKRPGVAVTVVRSPDVGVIGVGEGSGPHLVAFLHGFLRRPVDAFVRATRPGIKLGTRFAWGPRDHFFFPFGPHMQLKYDALPRPVGYYLDRTPDGATPAVAMMAANRVFGRAADGSPHLHDGFAYHVENGRFAAYLESTARELGATVRDGHVTHANVGDGPTVTSLVLDDGSTVAADLFVDCSGFASLLLGKALAEPFVSYADTLVCDRAVVGGWDRGPGEPMLAYTVSDTMDHGWSWRIDHPDRINRGYVYRSAFATDAEAEAELRRKNPRLTGPTRLVKFRSGRYARSWVGNVVAIGNASGFVEPLEATSLVVIATRCQLLAELLAEAGDRAHPAAAALFNRHTAGIWDSIRRFLAIHYKFNGRLDTPFWRHCRADVTDPSVDPLVDYYRLAGPSPALAAGLVPEPDVFGIGGALTILTGLGVAYRREADVTAAEWAVWDQVCRHNAAVAANGLTVEQALAHFGVESAAGRR